MSNKVFEDAPQPSGEVVDRIRKQVGQLAYDVRYKVKGKFKEGQKTSPAALKRAYMQQLGASSAPGPVKAMAQKMLIGEAYDMIDISSSLEGLKESVFANVFSEGKTTVLRVSDPRAKTTYYRSYNNYEAASAKKRELEKKGLKVEMTGRKDEDTYDRKGGEKKAKKDYDGDGKIESGTAEYMGSRDKAIKKAMAKEEVEVSEAKVDAGLDDEGKEDARNYRKFGTNFNQHKTSVLRRSLHRSRRGDKKVKGVSILKSSLLMQSKRMMVKRNLM